MFMVFTVFTAFMVLCICGGDEVASLSFFLPASHHYAKGINWVVEDIMSFIVAPVGDIHGTSHHALLDYTRTCLSSHSGKAGLGCRPHAYKINV